MLCLTVIGTQLVTIQEFVQELQNLSGKALAAGKTLTKPTASFLPLTCMTFLEQAHRLAALSSLMKEVTLIRSTVKSDTPLKRQGRVNALWALLAGGAAVVAAMAFLLSLGGPGQAPQAQTLVMHCAAGLRVPVEEIAAEY